MTSDFEDCLRGRRISRFSRGVELKEKEIKTAEKDLSAADKSFSQKEYKWATIQAYYSMFHSARSLLYAKNYAERSHFCLIAAIRALYVDEKLLSYDLLESLILAKRLREDADYSDDWSKESAGSIIESARNFLSRSKEIIV